MSSVGRHIEALVKHDEYELERNQQKTLVENDTGEIRPQNESRVWRTYELLNTGAGLV